MLTVVERFVSINGEGAHAGELAVFIRFKGCNLGCSYCDTKWANSSGADCSDFTADALVSWIRQKGIKNVTLTGGEPLLQDDIDVLINKLLALGLRQPSAEPLHFRGRAPRFYDGLQAPLKQYGERNAPR